MPVRGKRERLESGPGLPQARERRRKELVRVPELVQRQALGSPMPRRRLPVQRRMGRPGAVLVPLELRQMGSWQAREGPPRMAKRRARTEPRRKERWREPARMGSLR